MKRDTATREECEISICVDCLCFLANGDEPADRTRQELVEAIDARWNEWDIVPSCPEDCEGWFAWSPCECCGEALGGERHPAIAFRCEEEAAS